FSADEPLDGEDRIVGIGNGLALGDLAHHPLPGLGIHRDDRRRQSAALRVGNDDGLAALHHRDDRVGCSEIDSDYFWHVVLTVRWSLLQARLSRASAVI